MDAATILQFAGAITGGLVVLNELVHQVREWRGGTPELRLIKEQLKWQNDHLLDVMKTSNDCVSRIAKHLGV